MTTNEPLMEKKVLNAGLVALMGVDGTDMTAVQAARTSYRDFAENHTDEQNENIVDYMMRHAHATPFEFASCTFYMVMPIFVARQMVRHRTSSINEESLRYVEAREEFYIPSREECKGQSKTNKQGSGDLLSNGYDEEGNVNGSDDAGFCIHEIASSGNDSKERYNSLLRTGLSKELSRTVLPLGQYTAWYWKANLRNIYHLLNLRLHPHAQYQIRVYAEAMLEMIREKFPVTTAAWENHVLNAVTFSADEWKIIKDVLDNHALTEEPINVSVMQTLRNVIGASEQLRGTRRKELSEKITNA